MKQEDLISKLALVREKVLKTMDMISVQGLLPEADAILNDIINDLIKGPVEE